VVKGGWSNFRTAEFGSISFGDGRLNKRFELLVEQISKRAGRSIPFACQDWADAKAAYRFFDNPKVEAPKILGAHSSTTIGRARKFLSRDERMLLVIQDTTYFNYSRHIKTEGLGQIAGFKGSRGEKLKARGLILHSALAVTPDGVPLGIVDSKLWTRTQPAGWITESGKNTSRIPIETKESFRWIEALRRISTAFHSPGRLVHVCDRESDIIEFFLEAKEQRTHFVVRIRDSRRHIEGGMRIFDPVMTMRPEGCYELPIVNSDGIKRTARVEVKYYPVTVLPSVEKQNLQSVAAWVISATEVDPPNEEERIDWKLLTDIPIASFDEAFEKINWYTMRWKVEVFHKVLKSGCRILDCRLQSADRLIRYVALMCVVAWRIFWMTNVTRINSEIRPAAVLTPEEMKSIRLYMAKKRKSLGPQKTAKDWIRALARIGGFLGRKSDGDPGPFTLWRGYLRLQDIVLGVSLTPECGRCG
jgi:hypothetical protein